MCSGAPSPQLRGTVRDAPPAPGCRIGLAPLSLRAELQTSDCFCFGRNLRQASSERQTTPSPQRARASLDNLATHGFIQLICYLEIGGYQIQVINLYAPV